MQQESTSPPSSATPSSPEVGEDVNIDQKEYDYWMTKVQTVGLWLRDAPEQIQRNKEICLEAVKKEPDVIQYCHETLKRDPDILRAAGMFDREHNNRSDVDKDDHGPTTTTTTKRRQLWNWIIQRQPKQIQQN